VKAKIIMPFKKKKKKKLGPNCVNPNYALKKKSNPNTFTKFKKLGFTKIANPNMFTNQKLRFTKTPPTLIIFTKK